MVAVRNSGALGGIGDADHLTCSPTTGGGKSDRTGIWHETYRVRAGEYEAVYGNMPPFGLGKAGRLVSLSDFSTARQRLETAARPVPT